MNNITHNILEELRKRLNSAFWGPFIISWLVVNWKIVYLTTSLASTKIDEKITYIQNYYSSGVLQNLLHLFIYPLIASLIGIGLVPFLSYFYLKIENFHKKRFDNIKSDELDMEIDLATKKEELANKKKLINSIEKSEQDLWDEDYEEIEKSGVIPILAQFIYRDNGRRFTSKGDNISVYDFANASRYGLLLDKGDHYYSLSNKGEYILRKYPSDKLKEFLIEDIPF